ncbi:MAG: DUF4115 domain-containing protein [Candidatus Abawacabacteria bacterium]|nr:DUF4115 domain-containing protein [Candidatus Abawacabacteria bacterium]
MNLDSQFIGDYLHTRRTQFGITLAEIERDTGIRPEYINALEQRDFDRLPADIYLLPIVKSYARYLGANERSVVQQLKTEKEYFSKHHSLIASEEKQILSHAHPVTGKRMFLGLAAATLGLVVFYITQQFFNVSSPPNLIIFEPANGVSINNPNILVKGRTSNGSKIELNGKTVSTDGEGNFNVPINLNNGENHIAIVATSNNGQKIGESLLVYATLPDTTAVLPDHLAKDSLTMEITAHDTTWISIKADGESLQKTLKAGDKEAINGKDIDLIAGNAGGIAVALNGGNPILLGEKGQVIRKHFSWNDLNIGYLTSPNLK